MTRLVIGTEFGRFAIGLHERDAPNTCRYFAELVRANAFFDGGIFRVLSEDNQTADEPHPIQVVQIAREDKLEAERHRIEHEDTRKTGLTHTQWTVSAARFEPGEVYGSFFVCMRDEPELDYGGQRHPDGEGFAAFARVESGFDTLAEIYRRAEASQLLSETIALKYVELEEGETSG